MVYTPVPPAGTGAFTLTALSGLTSTQIVFGSATGAGASSADLTYNDTTNTFQLSASEASGTVDLKVINTNATAGAARLTLQVEPAGGDAAVQFSVASGGTDWTMGVRNANDSFVIAKSTALNTTQVFEIIPSSLNVVVGPVGGTYRLDVTNNATNTAVVSAVRSTSNTASAAAGFLAEVAGTTASDATSQWSVAGVRQFTAGIDTSVASQPFVFSVGTALGTTDVYSINSAGEMGVGGLPITGERFRIRGTADIDIGCDTTSTSSKATVKGISGALSSRLVCQGSTVAGTTNGINNTSLTLLQTSAGSIMMTAPDSTSTLYFATNGAIRASVTGAGNVAIGAAAVATTATDGFLHVTACAGPPTGVPTAITGRVPIVVDSTNNKLYFYSGGAWRDAGP